MMLRAWVSLLAIAVVVGVAAVEPATAAVKVGADRIVVSNRGAIATIERDPLRISYSTPGGKRALAEVGDVLGAPGAEVNLDPEPVGFDAIPETGLYAPLTFEVGGEQTVQHPGGLFAGNMLAGLTTGVVHFGLRVTAAKPDGSGGVDLTVATTDPVRDLGVNLAPDGPGAIRLRARPSNPGGVSSMADSFASPGGEAFHGFGGRHNSIDQAGNDFYNWIEEEAQGTGPFEPIFVATGPASGGDTYTFPNGPFSAYYNQNSFISSAPYGFLLNTTNLSRWRMASGRPDAWQVISDGPSLDYTVTVGGPKKAVRNVTRINGRHRVPPKFAMGPAIKRNVQQGNASPEIQQELITQDIADLKKFNVKLEMYCYESWNTLPREFVRETNRTLAKMGIHPCGYVRAYVNDDGNFDPPGTLQDAIERDVVAKTPGGAPFISVAVGPAAVLDFTSPKTEQYWREKLFLMFDLGFDGFMQDFGEQAINGMVFSNGETGETMHNKYPNIYHRVAREIMDEYEARHPERGKLFMYTRAGFSGRPGSAAYESANFPGDENSDYSRANGIPFLTTDMLNRAVGGSYGYTTDIGGYFDTLRELDRDLFMRWTQWAALSPFFRLHNSCCSEGTQMPWAFDHEALANWKRMSRLHVRARPYIRQIWRKAQKTGIPPTRPLWMQFARDGEAAKQDQEWMLGPKVLVAPVVEEDATTREVYFPNGCWRNPETRKTYRGAGYIEVPASLTQLPYYFRCGTRPFEIPRNCTRLGGASKLADRLTGTAGSDRIRGRKGNDELRGRGDSDCLNGGPGNDRVGGGGGDDSIRGAFGSDRLRGGPGEDTINGGPGLDRISGGPGDDRIKVIAGGRDLVDCGRGTDTVRATRTDRLRRCEKVLRS